MAQTKEMLSKQAVQTREILSKQAVKIAKQAEEHERFINKAGFFLVLLYLSSVVEIMGFRCRIDPFLYRCSCSCCCFH